MKTTHSLCLLILSFCICCNSQQKKDRSELIASVGDRVISVDDFRAFYNFDVNFGVDSSGFNALKDELDFYVDQVLALHKAESEGLVDDPVFVKSVNWEKKQAALRQLYRQEITDRIKVSEQELKGRYLQDQTLVRLRHIFFENYKEAETAYLILQNGETFENIARQYFSDSSLALSAGDLGWMKISELEKELSASVKELTINEISKPLKSKWGYHLVQILDKKEQKIVTQSAYEKALPQIEKKIKAEKSKQLSQKFIQEHIAQINPQPDAKMFEKIWRITVPAHEREQDRLSRKYEIDNYKLLQIKERLKDDLTKPFINYKGGYISVNEFLENMELVPLSHRLQFQSRRDLSNQIGKWVRDEFLFRLAREKGIDKHSRVHKETVRFMEEQSYYYYHGMISDSLNVPDYVRKYFSESNKSKSGPHDLRNYHTLQGWIFDQAKKVLHKQLREYEVPVTIQQDILREENKRVNWGNKIRMFMIRKPS